MKIINFIVLTEALLHHTAAVLIILCLTRSLLLLIDTEHLRTVCFDDILPLFFVELSRFNYCRWWSAFIWFSLFTDFVEMLINLSFCLVYKTLQPTAWWTRHILHTKKQQTVKQLPWTSAVCESADDLTKMISGVNIRYLIDSYTVETVDCWL